MEQYPKVVDVFLGPIKHELSVDVAVPCGGGSICVPFDEVEPDRAIARLLS